MHTESVVDHVVDVEHGFAFVISAVPHIGLVTESASPRATYAYPNIAPTALPFAKVTSLPVGFEAAALEAVVAPPSAAADEVSEVPPLPVALDEVALVPPLPVEDVEEVPPFDVDEEELDDEPPLEVLLELELLLAEDPPCPVESEEPPVELALLLTLPP